MSSWALQQHKQSGQRWYRQVSRTDPGFLSWRRRQIWIDAALRGGLVGLVIGAVPGALAGAFLGVIGARALPGDWPPAGLISAAGLFCGFVIVAAVAAVLWKSRPEHKLPSYQLTVLHRRYAPWLRDRLEELWQAAAKVEQIPPSRRTPDTDEAVQVVFDTAVSAVVMHAVLPADQQATEAAEAAARSWIDVVMHAAQHECPEKAIQELRDRVAPRVP